ncbi:hypothetical protein DOT_1893 [Desulfosporosinus sp. OT]|nr:hypothetical protein DOT_1893 [Desulfosporosinus sp. OT]
MLNKIAIIKKIIANISIVIPVPIVLYSEKIINSSNAEIPRDFKLI